MGWLDFRFLKTNNVRVVFLSSQIEKKLTDVCIGALNKIHTLLMIDQLIKFACGWRTL